jgi:simple sugar transport system permease protein
MGSGRHSERGREHMKRLTRRMEFYVLIAVVGFAAIITCFNPRFLSLENVFDLLKSCSVLGILSVGMFIVILSGGIDISCAAVAQVSEYVMVAVINQTGGNLLFAVLVACACGTILGAVNGSLIYFLKIPPIITTIATYNIFYGLLYVFSKGQIIISYPKYLRDFAGTSVFHLTSATGSGAKLSIVVVMWILVALLTFVILRFTSLGRNVYCIGGNTIAAQRAGISVFRTQMFVYCFMGLLAGVAAVAHFCVVLTVVPSSIVGRELDAIAAVVLGGTSIVGGSGTVVGGVLGVILFAMMGNGLTLMKVSSYWYKLLIGLVILVSISISAVRMRASMKKSTRG